MTMTNASIEQLAAKGGVPVRTKPFPVRKLFGQEEKAAMMALFDRAIEEGSHLLGYNGEQETKYCEAFAAMLGGGFADGVNSGTSSVYVALKSLELEPFSEVIVPPVTDPGGIMPVALLNLVPVTVDTGKGSYNITAETIATAITPRTKAIVVAHIAGIPADMDAIMALARKHNLYVVEDCAQAHGASYKGRPVGTFGEVAAFSTMFGKHHATLGQGGVVFTKSQDRYWKVRQHADRGKPFGVTGNTGNVAASLNMNMDEAHACVGREQLKKLPGFVAKRIALADRLAAGLAAQSKHFKLQTGKEWGAQSSYWFFLVECDLKALGVANTAELSKLMAAEGVHAGAGYGHFPVTHDWYTKQAVYGQGLPWKNPVGDVKPVGPAVLKNILAINDVCLMMGLHEGYGNEEIDDTIAALVKIERNLAG
jgi:perosamine synthetase